MVKLIDDTQRRFDAALKRHDCQAASGPFTHLQRLIGRFDADTDAAGMPRGQYQYERGRVRRLGADSYTRFYTCVVRRN